MVKLSLVERKPLTRNVESEQPTVGVIDAISTGFERVFRHPWLLIIPILLDLFLWVGPRLDASALYDQLSPSLKQMSTGLDTDSQQAVQEMDQVMKDFLTHYNLYAWLSVGIVGVQTINSSLDATAKLVTGAMPTVSQIGDLGGYLLAAVGLSLIGLCLAGFFWALLGLQFRDEAFSLTAWLKRGAVLSVRLLSLAVTLLIGVVLLMLPISMLTVFVGALSIGLASFIPALALTALTWLAFYFLFTVHGLVLYQFTWQKAARFSAMIARVFFVPTLGLAVLSLAIYIGLGLIWDSIAPDSWLRLIAIVGNAFIATGLAMASLVYYQNRSSILFERLHFPKPAGN